MDRTLKNIIIEKKAENLKYTPARGGGGEENYPPRKRIEHGKYIESQFALAWEKSQESRQSRLAISTSTRDGVYLQVKGKCGYDFITKSLEDSRQNVRIINIQEVDGVSSAVIYVPNNKKDFFIKKINKYKETESGTDVVGTIEDINIALIEALWIGNKDSIPKENSEWCEIWLRYEIKEKTKDVFDDFLIICNVENIKHKDNYILFPERIVAGIYANMEQLKRLQLASSRLAEIRKMSSPVSFFTSLEEYEQREWQEELLDRVVVDKGSKTTVCLLDTGVNNGHPLLKEVLLDSNCNTVDISKGTDDKANHGTRMAGVVTYFDLAEKLNSTSNVEIHHYLESVKIMDKSDDNPEELYGEITSRAISLAEVENPFVNRVLCMPITTDSDITEDGRPSSWSGAIDEIILGTTGKEKRIMCISAGNTFIGDIYDNPSVESAITNTPVKSPGQSWNAITVGAFTEKVTINDEQFKGYQPVANAGALSPFTSTSMMWDYKKWPIKPEIVLEGGNLASKDGFYTEADDLSLLTTSKNFMTRKPFDTISMTSAATAQASWLVANIRSEYPQLWPETVRALLIHSAEWTEEMKHSILGIREPKKSDYRKMLRMCGYGVPNLSRAINSAKNSVNLIIQDEMQPFVRRSNYSITSNAMCLHEIPWPSEVLLGLENAPVKMKLTLSYYIDPAPGEIGWKDKYRYQSCGLVFDVNNPTEGKEMFMKRISKAMRDEEEDSKKFKNDSKRWMLGTQNRDVGSIHSDVWNGTAGELSQSNFIMVYPTTGWWKLRTNLKKYNSKIRYALVVSIETPKNEIDLYSVIKTKIATKIPIPTTVSKNPIL